MYTAWPQDWNGLKTDASSGDQVWHFDFSQLTAPGTYEIVDPTANQRSARFEIDDNVYRNVLIQAVRMFYYQRAGQEKTVANIKSAQKQNRKMIKHRARNRAAMASLRTAVKTARTAVDGKAADAQELLKKAVSIIDSAVTKGILKRQTASRYVSRLATRGRA